MSLSIYLKSLFDASIQTLVNEKTGAQSYENTLKKEDQLKLSQQKMWERLYAAHQRPIYQKMLAQTQQSIDLMQVPNLQENV